MCGCVYAFIHTYGDLQLTVTLNGRSWGRVTKGEGGHACGA